MYINAQPNITSVGSLTGLTVNGNATINGDLTINGNIDYINSNIVYVEAPILTLGGGPNNTPLTSDDGFDRGTVLDYYTTTPVSAFMGWKNANGEFQFGSNVSVTNNIVTVNTFGNIKAGSANLGNAVRSNYFIGDGSYLSNVNGSNVSNVANANYAAYAGIASTANSVAGANVTGIVANANYAAYAGNATCLLYTSPSPRD